MDKNVKAFVIYITFWLSLILIYLAKKTQITLLIIKKIIFQMINIPILLIFFQKKSFGITKNNQAQSVYY